MNPRLAEMLTYARPYAGAEEKEFVRRFITSAYKHTEIGPMENICVEVGHGSRTLFSCHTDTAHFAGGRQKVLYDTNKGHAFKNDGRPLGADDAAGVWLLLEMIDAGIPGTYLFHRGEEKGGIGSHWMAEHTAPWLEQFDRAIAFDRKATHSVITHQGWSDCASQEFAEALATALNAHCDDFMYVPDDTGVFTDTANYVDLIPECTNVSCGYYHEHTAKEFLDVIHLEALRHACLNIDWEALPTVRSPEALEYADITLGDLQDMPYAKLLDLCMTDPELIADIIYASLEEDTPDPRQSVHSAYLDIESEYYDSDLLKY